jgi:hypothetical protein
MKQNTPYSREAARIRACRTREDFVRAEKQYTRHYETGNLTPEQLASLDVLAMELQTKITP